VTFDIDANGICTSVPRTRRPQGKQITIKANSGLTEQEIQKMVQDAEANAEEDKRLKDLAESHNQGDALVHSTRKALTEYGDKLEAGEKEVVEAAIKDLEEALKGNDKPTIDAKSARCDGGAKARRKNVRRHAGATGGGRRRGWRCRCGRSSRRRSWQAGRRG